MPFCPQCRFEYEPEINICPECGVPLVAELPPEEEAEWQGLVTVYSALDFGEAALVESLLQGSDIPTFLANEQAGLTMAAPLTAGWFQVQVPPEYVERAQAIIEEADHWAEQPEAPAAPKSEEMDLPEMDADGEV